MQSYDETEQWQRWREYQRVPAAAVVNSFVQARGLPFAPPMPIFDLATWLDTRLEVVPASAEQPNWSGALDYRYEQPVIWRRERDTHTHQRFTVAHELGHLLLGHHHEGVIHRDVTFRAEGAAGAQERNANAYAAELLMPPDLVAHQVQRHGAYQYKRLAPIFQVSPDAMMWRLVNLGYLR